MVMKHLRVVYFRHWSTATKIKQRENLKDENLSTQNFADVRYQSKLVPWCLNVRCACSDIDAASLAIYTILTIVRIGNGTN